MTTLLEKSLEIWIESDLKEKDRLLRKHQFSDACTRSTAYMSFWKDGTICLDGDFALEDLEYIVNFMKEFKKGD